MKKYALAHFGNECVPILKMKIKCREMTSTVPFFWCPDLCIFDNRIIAFIQLTESYLYCQGGILAKCSFLKYVKKKN